MTSTILTWTFTRRGLLTAASLTVGGAVLAACAGTTASAQPSAASTPEPDPVDTPRPSSAAQATQAAAPGTFLLVIGSGAGATDFKYDKTTLEAPAGSKIALKFTNNTKLSDEVGHNWVLVKPGQEATVLANAAAAGDLGEYLKADDPGIIAHTALIEGGSSDTITFDAPAPGSYTYLSTYPKQYESGMKGTLTVK